MKYFNSSRMYLYVKDWWDITKPSASKQNWERLAAKAKDNNTTSGNLTKDYLTHQISLRSNPGQVMPGQAVPPNVVNVHSYIPSTPVATARIPKPNYQAPFEPNVFATPQRPLTPNVMGLNQVMTSPAPSLSMQPQQLNGTQLGTLGIATLPGMGHTYVLNSPVANAPPAYGQHI